MRRFLFASLPLCLLLGWAGRGAAQADPSAVIDKAVTALGGEARLNRYKAKHNKTRGTLHALGGVPFSQEVFYQSPGQMKETLRAGGDGQSVTLVTALNGDQGWSEVDGSPRPLDARTLAELKETAHLRLVCRCTVLKDKAYLLTPIGEFPIDGRATIGVRVSAAGHRDIQLYFDREFGLLVKTERTTANPRTGKAVREEAYYKDWKDIDGIVTPTRVVVYQDGKRFMEAESYDIRYLEKMDDAVFANTR